MGGDDDTAVDQFDEDAWQPAERRRRPQSLPTYRGSIGVAVVLRERNGEMARRAVSLGIHGIPPVTDDDQLLLSKQPCDSDALLSQHAVPSKQWVILPIMWLLIGLSNGIPGVAYRQFLVHDLKAEPSTQALLGVLTSLSWNLKLLFAFTSDSFPVCGRRRKPYLLLGLCMQAGGWSALGLLPPALASTATLQLTSTIGQVVVGVMADTLVVETMRSEHGSTIGGLQAGILPFGLSFTLLLHSPNQSNCWIGLSIGSLLGTLCGGWVLDYTAVDNQNMFLINGMLKLAIIGISVCVSDPVVSSAVRKSCDEVKTELKSRLADIWAAMKEYRVWRPLVFVFIMEATPNNGDAFTSFLLEDTHGLGFSDSQYAYLTSIAGIGSAVGAWAYKRFLRDVTWHVLFPVVIVVSALLSATQLILILRVNRDWGIPDLVFAIGDDVINEVARLMIAMPILVLLAKICPEGSEGSVYALVTTLQNVGATVGGTISAEATKAFGVTLNDFSALWKLTVLVSSLKLLPLFFVPFVPNTPEQARDDDRRSRSAAVALATIIFGGLVYAIAITIIRFVQLEPSEDAPAAPTM